MNLSFHIARRYILGKKSHNAINLISAISVGGVFIGSMALIVVLSVFNGFEGLVISLYNSFDPDYKITAVEGKIISLSPAQKKLVYEISGVENVSLSIEENALLKYKDKQYIATIKGVDKDFQKVSGIDSMISEGKFLLEKDSNYFACLGQGVAYQLSLNTSDIINPISVYLPKKEKSAVLNPEDAFNSRFIYPSSTFSIQQDFDNKYVIVPIAFCKELLEYGENEYSSLEIATKDDISESELSESLKKIIGSNIEIKNRYRQHEFLYKVMKAEKWSIFVILTFILIIATFNIVGSITMLIMDKTNDIKTLQNLGANRDLISKIFVFEGLLISLSGAILGIICGVALVLIQKYFHIIKLGEEGTFLINYYPVKIMPMDFLYVFLTISVIGLTSAILPVKIIMKKA